MLRVTCIRMIACYDTADDLASAFKLGMNTSVFFASLGYTVPPGSYVIMDNASIHNNADLLYLLRPLNITLVKLPTYSYDLNPIEMVNGLAKAYAKRNPGLLRTNMPFAIVNAFSQNGFGRAEECSKEDKSDIEKSPFSKSSKVGKYIPVQPEGIMVGSPSKFQGLATFNQYSCFLSEIDDDHDVDFADTDEENEVVITDVKPIKQQLQSSPNLEASSSGEESVSSITSSSSESNVRISAGKTYLNIDMWKDVPLTKVDYLPADIDGLNKFQLPFDPRKRMASSQDGRKWQRYVSSKRRGFDGVRKLAQCKGYYRCDNTHCDFLREYDRPNRHHFHKKGKDMKCDHCHVAGKFVQCTARKIWEFDDATEKVTIFHYGVHSCIPTPKRNKDADRKIEEAFRKNPKLKPGQMSVGCVVEAISEVACIRMIACYDTADDLASAFKLGVNTSVFFASLGYTEPSASAMLTARTEPCESRIEY
ncbi:hypothetical protein QZH41_007160 [Actinostola sp. cb2023]|nr:hypothetical protein QZH41_007160 [Actinostola sp. cb2023]